MTTYAAGPALVAEDPAKAGRVPEHCRAPLRAVWDNLEKVDLFLSKAKGSDIPLEWCLEIAAGGLWAAYCVLRDKVLHQIGEDMPNAGKWFKNNGPIVLKIRNAVEHHSFSYQIGQSFSPARDAPVDANGIAWQPYGSRDGEGETVATLVLLESEEIPVGEALNLMHQTSAKLGELVWDKTGVRYINFHVSTR